MTADLFDVEGASCDFLPRQFVSSVVSLIEHIPPPSLRGLIFGAEKRLPWWQHAMLGNGPEEREGNRV